MWMLIIVVVLIVYIIQNDQKTAYLPNRKKAAAILAELELRVITLLRFMKRRYVDEQSRRGHATRRMLERYNPDNIRENNPLISMGTAYSIGKGEKLVICLRNKMGTKIHDINTLMFVVLHEISHIGNDTMQHDLSFWKTFKVVLQEADRAGVYVPVDYQKNPVVYCGLKITDNPFFAVDL